MKDGMFEFQKNLLEEEQDQGTDGELPVFN
jgi:hypothetical protein